MHNSFPIQLLNGNSAKVWVLSGSSNPEDKNIAAMEAYRKSFIFYSDLSFREQELIHLGSNEGAKGSYQINEDQNGDRVLRINYSNDDRASFRINAIENNRLTLQKLEDDETIWEFRSLKPPRL